MIDKETLDKLHQVHLELIDEVDRICREHDLTYFLDSGTALGAVRHAGFIPWDDDADIGMPRADYEKFMEIAPKELKPAFFLQNFKTEPGYFNFHAKLRKENTVFPQRWTEAYKHRGIMIDIFPFDYVPDSYENAVKMVKKSRYIRWITDFRYASRAPKGIKKKVVYYAVKLLPKNICRRMFLNYCNKYNDKPTNTMTSFTYRMTRKKEYIFKKSDLLPVKRVRFEDRSYCIMQNPDAYLKTMYGDYMQLPPENERVSHLEGIIKF